MTAAGPTALVFPGIYTVDLPKSKVLTMKTATISTATVQTEDAEDQPLKISVVPAQQEAFDSFLTTFIDTCFAAAPDTRDRACPNWEHSNSEQISAVQWTLDERPVYKLSYDGYLKIRVKSGIVQTVSYADADPSWFTEEFTETTYNEDDAKDTLFSGELVDGDLTFVPFEQSAPNEGYGTDF